MNVVAIYGSPRKGGNSETLLQKAMEGARQAGAQVSEIRACDLKIEGCRNCGGCDKTGKCVIDDDMQQVYPQLEAAEAIVLSVPIFFYSPPAQAKALIDRCQALWSKRMLTKTKEQRKTYDSGQGWLIAVGATKGQNLFACSELVAKYFYDALDMSYEGGLTQRGLEGKNASKDLPELLTQSYELGQRLAAKV
jgi:multimeric flavodoxin WrbA